MAILSPSPRGGVGVGVFGARYGLRHCGVAHPHPTLPLKGEGFFDASLPSHERNAL